MDKKEPDSLSKRVRGKTIGIAFGAGIVVGILVAIVWQAKISNPAVCKMDSSPPGAASKIQDLQYIVQKDSLNAGAWIELGNLFYDTRRSEEAIDAYAHALKIKPDNPDVLTDMGVMYRNEKMFPQAIECFEKALTIDPKHRLARYNKGAVLLNDLLDRNGAIAEWEMLLKVDSKAVSADGQSIAALLAHLKTMQNKGIK